MFLEQLSWDTEFFGFEVARLNYSSTLDLAALKNQEEYKYRLTYIFAEQALEEKKLSSNIYKAGSKLLFRKAVQATAIPLTASIVSYPNQAVSQKLLDLAYQSGIYSRFKLDPKMPKDSFERMYKIWIEASVNRSIAEEVYVYKVEEEIAGMITLGIKKGHGNIGLIAVDHNFRAQGIGGQLLAAANNFCLAHDLEYLDVATQRENTGAVQFYNKNGFAVAEEDYIYHYWNEAGL